MKRINQETVDIGKYTVEHIWASGVHGRSPVGLELVKELSIQRVFVDCLKQLCLKILPQ